MLGQFVDNLDTRQISRQWFAFTTALGRCNDFFVAGLIATVALAFLAPWLVEIAVKFGPEDYFALMVLAFVTVSAAAWSSPRFAAG